MGYHNRYDEEWIVTWVATSVVVLVIFVVWRKYRQKNNKKTDLHTRETQTGQYKTVSSETQTDKNKLFSRETQTDKNKNKPVSRETQTDKIKNILVSRKTQTVKIKNTLVSRETQTDKNKIKLFSTETQTDKTNCLSTETQTIKSKRFTDNLTEFETRDLGSDEFFDTTCQICDTGKEAVGFCEWCEQYMCLKCCKHHEKIRFSENHVLKGKEDFLCSKKQVSMFGRKLIPVSAEDIENDYYLTAIINNEMMESFVLIAHNEYNIGIYHQTISDTCKTTSFKPISTGGTKCAHTYQDQEIHFYVIENRRIMRFCTEHKMAVECFVTLANSTSITKFNDGLAVAQYVSTRYSVPSWSIQFLDFEGNVNNYVVYDASGRPLFKHIYSITADNTGNMLYVCDEESCTITVLGTDGKLVRKITFSLDVCPRELVFDSEDNIYLACAYQVIQIDPLCKTFRVLFTLSADQSSDQDNEITEIRFLQSANRMIIVENSVTVSTFVFLSEYCRKSSIHKLPTARK